MRLLSGVIFFAAVLFAACATKEPVPESVPEPVAIEIPPEKEWVDEGLSKPLIDMILVSGGSFRMGNARETPNERPVHTVTLRSFLMGKREVTQGEYFEVIGELPSNFKTNADDESPDGWMRLPVEQVSWYHALVFCNRLSIKEKLNPVYRIAGSTNPDDWGRVPSENSVEWNNVEMISGADGYRLPTESEWEFAARGGGLSGNFNFSGHNNPDNVAWYFDNSEFKVREVGKKAPNELGLHDMSGNVMEWCWDWFGSYTSGAKDNPTGPPTSRNPTLVQYRVIRGGAWSVAEIFCRTVYRHNNTPSYFATNLGFRVVRTWSEPEEG